MIVFWIVAGILVLLSLALILPPLLGKGKRVQLASEDIDQNGLNTQIARERLANLETELETGTISSEDYRVARGEIEQSLLDDVDVNEAQDSNLPKVARGGMAHWAPALVGLLVPIVAVLFYLLFGDVSSVERTAPAVARSAQAPAGHNPTGNPDGGAAGQTSMAEMADVLAEKLEQDPENAEGWFMLGRTYSVLQRWDESASAYEMARSLMPGNAEVLAGLAESIAMGSDGDMSGQPRDLLEEALKVNAKHPKSLWLMGMADFQAKSYQGAVDNWMALLEQVGQDEEAFAELSRLIREAAGEGGIEVPEMAQADAIESLPGLMSPQEQVTAAASSTKPAAPQQTMAAQPASIRVSIALSDDLAAQVDPNTTLFVYAKATQGPPMPLAAMRLKASDLPITVMLNDQMAMMPSMKLSSFPQVTVGARISASGTAMPASGDLFGEVSPVEVKADQAVSVVIDQIRS